METFYRDKFEKVEERSQRLDRTGEKLEDNDASTHVEEEASPNPDE